jgi:hypothetical protein
MSLSTQLTRGTLALQMLVAFALLGFVEARPVDAQAQPVAKLEVAGPTCLLPAPHRTLVLAQAPADLGTLAMRRSQPCRA